MTDTTPGGTNLTFMRRLAEAGVDDTLVLTRETAETVMTEKRTELLEHLETGEVESVRELARRVDRDVSIVSRDLDILFEAGVVDFEKEGRTKRPVLARENVFVEPIVLEGEVRRRVDDSEEEATV